MAVTVQHNCIQFTAASDTYAAEIQPLFYRWIGATTAGHTCMVKEIVTGEVLYQGIAGNNYYTDVLPVPRGRNSELDFIDGIEVTTIESGTFECHFLAKESV